MAFRKSQLFPVFVLSSALILSGAFAGCSSAQKTAASGAEEKEAEQPATTNQVAELRTQMVQLQNKVDQLEGQVAAVSGKVEASTAASQPKAPFPNTSSVYPHPTQGTGSSVSPSAAGTDPESGFINDESVDLYRKSLLLLQSQKYSEAVLSFASFLEQFPDHPLAGSAQFHIGESYFRQKEYKLALHEFKRVLTSYDRNPHIASTLQFMIAAEEALKLPQDAAKHRQQLTSLFPQSPAAGDPQMIISGNSSEPSTAKGAATDLDAPPPTAPAVEGTPSGTNPGAQQ
ncbi:MAG TPA: hypothetical protein DCS07_17435 [Bdellovibrionales bacterium]|nr:MAG: hypothetical protein A2Z97_07685 [Bdellovibrionales bacterium GWB1_52_6]OFZ04760.1 MAG: hypothetical protein A2X97_13625 [Bdellovibrionales bacterium GWA1_52_35]OFZ38165.1 MAG: hypothetical protein A2070_01240 [Bdellovibrionales bacterium GWC1_52_8]HAR44384.1 hypothetical protein [Bdellovibrionales bacterium]HCM39574.1 hypothetical protein [Bdellovibrionales bacterium]